jgi:mRNA interferase MazF
MISSQLHQHIDGFDEIIHRDDDDFSRSGLKATSLIRVGRLAVAEEGMLLGAVGEIAPERLKRIKARLAAWLTAI